MKFSTIIALLLFASMGWGQAQVNEKLETAFIYVDVNTGSDSNPGTASQPLKTIGAATSKALSNNHQGVGSRVIINPGTYRESISMGTSSRATSLPITFEAATSGTVFVSGADAWTGWTPYSGNPNIFTQAWPYQWGECPGSSNSPIEQEIVLRREMIMVNGTPLTEVLSLTAMRPGTFFPDETNATVYVFPPAGTNMTTATVEVATRSNLFTDHQQSNLVLRGLTFQHANSCRQYAAVTISGATNVLIDTDSFLWNNAEGLGLIGVQNFTVQSSVANHNGEVGFFTYKVKNGLWDSDTVNYTNWRGAQGAYYTWDSGGGRFFLQHHGNFNNFTALFNQSPGVYFDTDNANITFSSLVHANNLFGFMVEKSEGPTTVSGSYLCGNNPLGVRYNGGIDNRDSTRTTLTGNVIFGNPGSQIALNGILGGISVTNWETGEVYDLVNENLTLSQNTIAGTSSTGVFLNYLGSTDWSRFASTLVSDRNTWWAGTNTSAFTVPTPQPGTTLDLSGWQSLTGQDMNSSWSSSARPPACNVQSQGPDFWLLATTFPVASVTASPSGQAAFGLVTLPLGRMTGIVNLSLDGLQAIPGATASFSASSVTTSGTSMLTLKTRPSTPPGTYPVTVIGNSGSLTRTVTVSVVVPTTSVWLSTTSLTFPGQRVGTTSSPLEIQLTNTGSRPLAIASISVLLPFSQTNTCGSSVGAGASCTINVTFSPGRVGTLTRSLTIVDADPTSPQVVSLVGTSLAAPHVVIAPTFLGFGLHKVGSSTTKPVALNNQGSAPLVISQMTIRGTNRSDFSYASGCGSSLAAGATCTVKVTFQPSAKGLRKASLTIYDNNNVNSSQTVVLQGGGD